MIGRDTFLVRRDTEGASSIDRYLVGILLAAVMCLPSPVFAVVRAQFPALSEQRGEPSVSLDTEATFREALRQEVPRLITDDPKRGAGVGRA